MKNSQNLDILIRSVTKRENKIDKNVDEFMLELRGDSKIKEKFEKMKPNDISIIRIEKLDNMGKGENLSFNFITIITILHSVSHETTI